MRGGWFRKQGCRCFFFGNLYQSSESVASRRAVRWCIHVSEAVGRSSDKAVMSLNYSIKNQNEKKNVSENCKTEG